ncbi:hypothetical protein CALCODRAFT_98644 [Calocera cornea HHB12733]|uniref:Uncharacterized protein n=1 Tax=Calocera cornea HHB12733 TaxID=1353952 RepID=A0A165D708_9BASI|nr:hypothetical protein CALCODRAFT_98644 [Calocera cornea HHB12733]
MRIDYVPQSLCGVETSCNLMDFLEQQAEEAGGLLRYDAGACHLGTSSSLGPGYGYFAAVQLHAAARQTGGPLCSCMQLRAAASLTWAFALRKFRALAPLFPSFTFTTVSFILFEFYFLLT